MRNHKLPRLQQGNFLIVWPKNFRCYIKDISLHVAVPRRLLVWYLCMKHVSENCKISLNSFYLVKEL